MKKESQQLDESLLKKIEILYTSSMPEHLEVYPTAYYTIDKETQAIVSQKKRKESRGQRYQSSFEYRGDSFYIYSAPL
jgi:hypothetical protein